MACAALLRSLPGKRKVLAAAWDGRPVIVKLFSHPFKARLHMKREWRGLMQLRKRKVTTPEPLFCGRSKGHGWAVVTERITDGKTAKDLWDSTDEPQVRQNLLVTVAAELAKHHEKGVVQKDLHLGNFLLKQQKVFVLDPSQMHFQPDAVGRKQTMGQLALLTSILPKEDEHSVRQLYDEYARARGWECTASDTDLLGRRLVAARKRRIRTALKKCMRTSKRHRRIDRGNLRAVLAREVCDAPGFSDFVINLDQLMEQGRILKKGNTSFVSHINFARREIVVKRYNHKGFIHSLRHSLKGSRARRCWLHAHRLGIVGVSTPPPLAFIEEWRGPLVWQSYFVTEYVHGKKLHDFLRPGQRTANEQAEIHRQVQQLVRKLGENRITHGDLKHTNILITERGPVLTDLDSMIAHRRTSFLKLRHARDHARLAGLYRAIATRRSGKLPQ